MKKLFDGLDKPMVISTILYKILTYLCWFLLAIICVVFISGEINRIKLFTMILFLLLVYLAKIFFKYLYNNNSIKTYQSIKHSVEMYYFKKLEYLDSSTLETIDRSYLGNKIIEVSYNFTKAISDIGEYIIPCIIGLILFFIELFTINFILGLLIFAIMFYIVYKEYYVIKDEEGNIINYNDMLIDFVNKLPDIRKLNCFKFCSKLLDNNTTNDLCLPKCCNSYDVKFDAKMTIIVIISIISTFVIVRHTIDILGICILLCIMMYILKGLIYKIDPTIKNILALIDNKSLLDSYYKDLKETYYTNDWKKISFKDAAYTYADTGLNIKIPTFEFSKGDNVSILGKQGQGKSTLLYILSGIYKLGSGNMFVDGKSTTKVVDSMFITRKTEMFNISLRDNLTLGYDISDEDIVNLINEIGLNNWFLSLPNGLDTILGNTLVINNKEREKLNLIRAIIANKDVYYLDEPTYDLDIDSEKIIADMIKKYWSDKTYVIVTHKPLFTNICKKHYFMKNHELLESEPLL